MKSRIAVAVLAMGALLAGAPAWANSQDKAASHGHDHSQDAEKTVAKGYFEDAQIKARTLSDWQGDWQSVYPYLADGTLDPVMAHKAEHGDKTAEEYRAYYEIGYKTDVDRIQIDGDVVTFHRKAGSVAGTYAEDGHEILTYEKAIAGFASSSRRPRAMPPRRPSSSSATIGSRRKRPITITSTGARIAPSCWKS